MKLRTISNVSIKGKRILLRIDINAAVYKGKPLDEPRFKAHAETISFLSRKGGKVVVIAHQGRKGGKDFIANLKEHAKILEKYSKRKIRYVDDLFGNKSLNKIQKMKNGEVVLLRNTRDYSDEKDLNNKKNRFIEFSKNFDIYVNDAFSVSHRAQASLVIPPRIIPSYAGPVLYEEFSSLKKFKEKEHKKMLLIFGGAKIEDYTPLIEKVKNKKTTIVAGGVLGDLILCNTGVRLGYEEQWLRKEGHFKLLKKIKKILDKNKKKIFPPIDVAVKKRQRKEISIGEFPNKEKIMDIGSKTIKLFKEKIKDSEVVLMKGPLGFSEIPRFQKGTVEILKEISRETKKGKIYSLIGGGHLTTTIQKEKIKNNFSHISLSGGALIMFLSGGKLPGLEAIKKV